MATSRSTSVATTSSARTVSTSTTGTVISSARSASASALTNSSSTSINTWPVVTTTGVQVIPSTPASITSSSSSRSNTTFPTAAIAVVAVVGGLVACFIGYRIYVFLYTRRFLANGGGAPLPEARPSGGERAMSMAYGSTVGLTSPGARDSFLAARRNNSSFSGYATTDGVWGGSTYGLANEKEPSSPLSPPGGYTPSPPGSQSGGHGSPISPGANISREGSPFGNSAGMASRGSLSAIPSSQSNRNSIASNSFPSRRSMYGPNALYNGPQLRSNHSSNRLSGAPHNPHTRIDIIPPLPLAPPPGTVVATDKSTLDFAPSAGLGAGLIASSVPEWYAANPHFDAGKMTPNGSSSGHGGSRSESSTGQHSFPPTPRGRDLRGGFEYNEAIASRQAPGNPRMSPPMATSPLDKLQQRIMIDSHMSQSRSSSPSGGGPFASGSSGRASRDEGPFAGGSSSGGSRSGEDKREIEEVGHYEAPSERLNDMMGDRRAAP